MFYRPADGHGLRHNPFNALVTPRPIGWLSTTGRHGDNLAPYSFFNAVAYTPPQVVVASVGVKDSARNIRETGVFAVNIVGEAMLSAMSATSEALPQGTDEFTHAGLDRLPCTTIACPRVAGTPATLECVLVEEVVLRGQDNLLFIAEVTGIHIADDCLVEGRVDITRYHPVGRMGYRDYAIVRAVTEHLRPGER